MLYVRILFQLYKDHNDKDETEMWQYIVLRVTRFEMLLDQSWSLKFLFYFISIHSGEALLLSFQQSIDI